MNNFCIAVDVLNFFTSYHLLRELGKRKVRENEIKLRLHRAQIVFFFFPFSKTKFTSLEVKTHILQKKNKMCYIPTTCVCIDTA